MQNGAPIRFIKEQTSVSGMDEPAVSPQSLRAQIKGNELVKDGHAEMISDAFINAVERLERILDKETIMLMNNQPVSFEDSNHKKRLGLIELSRALDAMRDIGPHCLIHDPKAPLARLRLKLHQNLTTLQMHLDAVHAIATIIAHAIQKHESDGTYTPIICPSQRP